MAAAHTRAVARPRVHPGAERRPIGRADVPASAEGPVLVVGGRTTGLVMAAELARHGVPVRIVDKSPGIDPHCRATVLHSRSLEVLSDVGVVDEVLSEATRLCGVTFYAGGQIFRRVTFGEVDSPFPYPVTLGQNRTEAILERHLARLGLTVERSTELVGLAQDSAGVTATLRHADGRGETVRAPWLVGCDGAHSRVRHETGGAFPGDEDPYPYALADVVLEPPVDPNEAYGYLGDHGVLYLFVLSPGRVLLVATLPRDREPAGEAPTVEEIQALVDERGPGAIRVRDPQWLAYFRIHYRLGPHYRCGRTLLAGDAAHIHSLIGGYGMNTGMQDAYNLAWKLALVIRGRASEALLESYEHERRTVAADVLESTRRMTEEAELWSGLSEAERLRLLRDASAPETERLRRRRNREQEELDLDYRSSPICGAPGSSGGDGFADGPHAGAEALDAGPLEVDGRSTTLFELLRGTAHTLLLPLGRDPSDRERVGATAAQAVGAYGDLLQVLLVDPHGDAAAPVAGCRLVRDPEGVVARRYDLGGDGLYLIRPDGYVGHRARPGTIACVHAYFDRLLGSRPRHHDHPPAAA
jgi:2-polyprenyl-6-methoxyphenol hydroxylase-like FAD-dependent oxidoreductase